MNLRYALDEAVEVTIGIPALSGKQVYVFIVTVSVYAGPVFDDLTQQLSPRVPSPTVHQMVVDDAILEQLTSLDGQVASIDDQKLVICDDGPSIHRFTTVQ